MSDPTFARWFGALADGRQKPDAWWPLRDRCRSPRAVGSTRLNLDGTQYRGVGDHGDATGYSFECGAAVVVKLPLRKGSPVKRWKSLACPLCYPNVELPRGYAIVAIDKTLCSARGWN